MAAVMSAPHVTSAELLERFGVTSDYLFRWHERGWIRGRWADHRRGNGGVLLWEPWVARMVPLLQVEHLPCDPLGRAARRANLEALARALRFHPDAPFFVWCPDEGDGEMVPALAAAEAVRLARFQPGPLRLVVSLPPAEG